jgi:hypothetical protein
VAAIQLNLTSAPEAPGVSNSMIPNKSTESIRTQVIRPCPRSAIIHRGLPRFIVTGLILAAASQAIAQRPVDIGSRRELFVDRLLIEEMRGVELKLHTPVKAPRPESPLPERHMVTVIKDGDVYRAWYRDKDPAYTGDNHTGNPGETVHYAESRDGHEWVFPKLGLHEVGGTRENNAILANWPPYLTNFMPFLDTRPGVNPEERYKALAGYPGSGNKQGLDEPGRGLFAFVSPDGIKWTRKGEAIRYRPEWRHAFDSPNVSFWSEAEGLYVCYFRTWIEPDRLRSISRATSADFVNWSEPVAMDPNLPEEHLYTNMTHPYFRAPHIYVAMPTRFIPGRGDSPVYDARDNNATDVLFMSARPGSTRYDRIFTEAFIRPGMDRARWGNRANYVALNVVPTGPAEMSIYHRSGDRYVLRTDGFMSAHAGSRQGELLTKPLKYSGANLLLNFATSAAGSVRVDILDGNGRILAASEEMFGDEIDRMVEWRDKTGPEVAAGTAVRLRFTLEEADVFSFQFTP